MKWEIPQPAKIGNVRIVEKFAWLPKKCVGNVSDFGIWTQYRVWLEYYTVTQEYKRVMKLDFKDSGHGYFEEEWVEVGATIIHKEKK